MTIGSQQALAVVVLSACCIHPVLAQKADYSQISDARLTTPQLITKYGYRAEGHHVVTADGYVLEVHRIARRGGPPVLLQHGLLCSSADWILTGPGRALGYLLADAGYDVWLGNARGNRYSRRHSRQLSAAQYWDFSFHEMGVFDLPAVIDYILQRTGRRQLDYIGHSMGTTMFYVLCSERPRYNARVRLMLSLSPTAFMSNIRSPLVRALVPMVPFVSMAMDAIGTHAFMPNRLLLDTLAAGACRAGARSQAICSNYLFLIVGFDSEQLNSTLLPVFMAHTPAGASAKSVFHYAQLARSGRFETLDRAALAEGFPPRRRAPPPPSRRDYALHRVKTPVALFSASNDLLSSFTDTERLRQRLGNVVGNFRVPYSRFNHMDFVWAKDAKTLLYDDVMRVMRQT